MKAETKTPIVRCALLGENESILMFREDVEVDGVKLSHWELPCGKIFNSDDNLEEAARRIVYEKTGLFANKLRGWVKNPTKSQITTFHDHHHYFLVEEHKGKTFLDEHKVNKAGHKKAMGAFQWIELEHLSCYAIRRETLAMLSQVLG